MDQEEGSKATTLSLSLSLPLPSLTVDDYAKLRVVSIFFTAGVRSGGCEVSFDFATSYCHGERT